jgi:hypothetical protein
MKTTLSFLVAMLFMAGVFAQSMFDNKQTVQLETASGTPKVEWKTVEHNFGPIPKGTPVSHKFEFTNTGEGALEITQVKPSCGCTATAYTKEKVKPGASGFVTAEFNAAREGVFTKTITVRTNTEEGVTLLRFRGIVEKASEGE